MQALTAFAQTASYYTFFKESIHENMETIFGSISRWAVYATHKRRMNMDAISREDYLWKQLAIAVVIGTLVLLSGCDKYTKSGETVGQQVNNLIAVKG